MPSRYRGGIALAILSHWCLESGTVIGGVVVPEVGVEVSCPPEVPFRGKVKSALPTAAGGVGTLQPNVARQMVVALERAGQNEVGGVLMAEHVDVNQFTIAELTN